MLSNLDTLEEKKEFEVVEVLSFSNPQLFV